MLRDFKVLQDGTTSYHAVMQVLHTKTFQVFYGEMMQQFLTGRLLCEHPIVEFESEYLITEILFKFLFLRAVKKNLLRLEAAQQFFHIVVGALARQELARRDVEKSHTAGSLAEMHGRQEVVLLVVQHVVAHGHARRHQFRDAALHQFFRQFRVFQLVADSHSPTRPDKFRQIGVEGVMRKTGHLVAFPTVSVIASCQCDTQDTGSIHGIITISFIEITTTEQQQSIGMLRLQVEKLFHHRGQFPVFLGHKF